MANYNVNLKKNKAFVAFLQNLKPGWAEEGGHLLLKDNSLGVFADNISGRSKWLPHEEWWQAYVQADRNHLKEREVAEFAAVIAAGEDCQLTVSSLRFLEFIADYYCTMAEKKPLRLLPIAEKQPVEAVRTALLSVAEYCTTNNVNTRKMRVASATDAVAVVIIGGVYLEFDPKGLVTKKAAPASQLVAIPADLDCPF